MRRAHSPSSDGSDIDADRQAEYEQEYVNLQRQYRLLERDKNTYIQESKDWIKKQEAEMEWLEMEHSELQRNSCLLQSDSNVKRSKQQYKQLESLGKLKNDCQSELKEEKKKQQELDKEIRKLEMEGKDRGGKNGRSGGGEKGGSKAGKASGGKTGTSSNTNDKRKLENQLQQANNKFGKLLESNRSLRGEIDSLRVERQKFEKLHQKLVRERDALKERTNELIEQSTQAYEQRVEAQEKMAALREKNEKDRQQHNVEVKELRRLIDHDNKLAEFMSKKGAERDEDKQLVAWRERKEDFERERKKASQTDSVESYHAAFEEIKKLSQQEDINLIVSQFIEGEEENFALLNLVNEQNSKIEQLQEDIERLSRAIDDLVRSGNDLELSRESILRELEEHQVSCSRDTQTYREKCAQLKQLLDEVKSGVGLLFSKISCDRSTIDESLGSEEGVTDGNVIEHLAIVEERTNQLLLTLSFSTKQRDIEKFVRAQTTLLGDGPRPHQEVQLQSIQCPQYSTELEAGELDDDKPLSREMLEEKVRQRVENLERRHQVNRDSMSVEKSGKSAARHDRVRSVRVK